MHLFSPLGFISKAPIALQQRRARALQRTGLGEAKPKAGWAEEERRSGPSIVAAKKVVAGASTGPDEFSSQVEQGCAVSRRTAVDMMEHNQGAAAAAAAATIDRSSLAKTAWPLAEELQRSSHSHREKAVGVTKSRPLLTLPPRFHTTDHHHSHRTGPQLHSTTHTHTYTHTHTSRPTPRTALYRSLAESAQSLCQAPARCGTS